MLIRGGLGLAALGAGLAGDLLGRLDWPLLGTLPPARAVLFVAGLVVAATALFIRLPRVERQLLVAVRTPTTSQRPQTREVHGLAVRVSDVRRRRYSSR